MIMKNSEMESLIELVTDINNLHKSHSEEWIDLVSVSYNLKSKQVRDIFVNSKDIEEPEAKTISTDFIKYLNTYCEGLNAVFLDPALDFLAPDLTTRARIKDPDSRVAKIMHYMNEKSENGKVNLNKCLNDLLGFRVWLNDFDHSQIANLTLEDELKKTGVHVKIHNSCKGDYKATHIYFTNGNNKFFPWELQIWNNKDDESNIYSHSVYKQGYTKWVKIYKERYFQGR